MSKRGNGEGTIYFSEKLNKWVGQFVAGRKDNGKLNRKSVYGNTRKEVKEKMTKALAEVQNNTFIEKNDITLIEIIDLLISEISKANRIKDTTYMRYIETKKIIEALDIAHIPIQKLTRADINNSLSLLTHYANSTIEKIYLLIRQAFNYAMLNEYIQKDFFSIKGAILKPISEKKDKEVMALDVEEQEKLVKELHKNYDKYTDIIYIALFTGMRIGEILCLRREDVDFENNQISVNKTLTKNKKANYIVGDTTKTYAGTRVVPILSTLYPILIKYQNTNGFLFSDNDKFILPSTIYAHFKRICKNAEIKVTTTKKKKRHKDGKEVYVNLKTSAVSTHMLRHTFATRCIEAGINPVVLQKILGHKDIQVTLNTYTDVFNKFKNKEIEKIETYFSQLH